MRKIIIKNVAKQKSEYDTSIEYNDVENAQREQKQFPIAENNRSKI